jgi:hypothetical protein
MAGGWFRNVCGTAWCLQSVREQGGVERTAATHHVLRFTEISSTCTLLLREPWSLKRRHVRTQSSNWGIFAPVTPSLSLA